VCFVFIALSPTYKVYRKLTENTKRINKAGWTKMCQQCRKLLQRAWHQMANGQRFRTPDAAKGVQFQISNIHHNYLIITPQNIVITKGAFEAALHYLHYHNHYQGNQCEIRSNNNYNNAGPLCQAARDMNTHRRRCINYILPVLRQHGIVAINSRRPNTTWIP
jgi:hypothetical protein